MKLVTLESVILWKTNLLQRQQTVQYLDEILCGIVIVSKLQDPVKESSIANELKHTLVLPCMGSWRLKEVHLYPNERKVKALGRRNTMESTAAQCASVKPHFCVLAARRPGTAAPSVR